MASGFGKKSIKDKFNAAVRKTVALTFLAGSLAVPGYYEYGTIKEKEVKIASLEQTQVSKSKNKSSGDDYNYNGGYYGSYYDNNNNDDYFGSGRYSSYGPYSSYNYTPMPDPNAVYKYKVITTEETFNNKKNWMHFKSQTDAKKIQATLAEGRIYKVRYYGGLTIPGINWEVLHPNILSVTPVSEQELARRAEAAKAKAKAEEEAKAKAAKAAEAAEKAKAAGEAQKPADGASAAQNNSGSALSGEVVTYPVTVNGYSVQLTVPVEVVGKVTVNTVKPVTPTQAPAPKP